MFYRKKEENKKEQNTKSLMEEASNLKNLQHYDKIKGNISYSE